MKKPLTEALWCDCETDEERADFIALGRACETGIVAKSIQSELVNVFRFRAGIMKDRRESQVQLCVCGQACSDREGRICDKCYSTLTPGMLNDLDA